MIRISDLQGKDELEVLNETGELRRLTANFPVRSNAVLQA